MILDTPLTTDRLLLRTLSASDVTERYCAWLQDPDVIRFLEVRLADRSAEATRDFVGGCNASGDNLLLGMFLRADGVHIGNIKLGPIVPVHRHANIGLMLGERSVWGRGLATEAIGAVTQYAFSALGLNKVMASCYGANEGSRRAFLKAGYTELAHRPRHWWHDGAWDSGILMEALNPAALS